MKQQELKHLKRLALDEKQLTRTGTETPRRIDV